MSNGELVFRNFRSNIARGKDFCAGILYCGKKYTSNNGCACLGCDGTCGPDNGCACPDCDLTLAYILYCTGEMHCPFCKSMLLRLNIFNIKKLNDLDDNAQILCNGCNQTYHYNFLPIMHCRKCCYNLCPNCAFSKISLDKLKSLRNIFNIGNSGGEGIFYCGKKYVFPSMCICSSCDGQCGPYNGCPCPICDLILSYNLYLNSHMKCNKCSETLLVKTTLKQLEKYAKFKVVITCDYCLRCYKYSYNIFYHCYKCEFDLCQICAYDIIKNRKILYPNLPMKSYENNIINIPKENIETKKEKLSEKKSEIKKNEDDDEDNENNNDEMKCVICLENNKCYIFMPCKHVCCCEGCAQNLKQCPICRNNIESSFKIFL